MILVDTADVTLHPHLPWCPPALAKKLKKLMHNEGINALDYSRVNTPFILKDKQQQLLSHHCVYLIAKHTGVRSIYMREVLAMDQVSDILAIDKLNLALLEQALLGKGTPSEQTQSHQRRRSAQQICPFCPGFLTGQKSKQGKVRDGKEFFEIKCHYRHYKNYNCDFLFELEKKDYILFKKGKFPTAKWLNKLDEKRCPICKDLLFERKSSDGKVFHQCRKTLIRRFPGEDLCDYSIEIKP